jgi:hypothetical protein
LARGLCLLGRTLEVRRREFAGEQAGSPCCWVVPIARRQPCARENCAVDRPPTRGGAAMSETAIDEARMGRFICRVAGYMTGGALCVGVWLGDMLGLCRALTEGAQTANELASATGCHRRLLREWADGVRKLRPRPEATAALAHDTSAVFVSLWRFVVIDRVRLACECLLRRSSDHMLRQWRVSRCQIRTTLRSTQRYVRC